jgi:hypothetical protein
MNTSVKMLTSLWVLVASALVLPSPSRAQTRNIEVDFSKAIGTIRPLNGVNGGPIVTRGAFDLSPQFSTLRLPPSRGSLGDRAGYRQRRIYDR